MRKINSGERSAENFFARLARAVEQETGERDLELEGMAYAAQFAPPIIRIKYTFVILLLVATMIRAALALMITTSIIMLVVAINSTGVMRDVFFWGSGGLAFGFGILLVVRWLLSK